MEKNSNQNIRLLLSQSKQQKSVLYYPMKLVQLYLSFIIVLYIFGPFEWPTREPLLLYSFLFSAQIILFMGYKSSMKRNCTPTCKKNIDYEKFFLKYLKYAITTNLVFVILNTIRNTGMSSFSLVTLLGKVNMGLLNPGQQYHEKFVSATFGGSILTYTTVILSPFLWMVLPLSLYYFKKLNLFNKILTIIAVVFEAARWISVGTNKGIIDLIIIFSSIILIKHLQSRYSNGDVIKTKYKNKFKIYIPLLILLVIGMTFFTNAINSRVGGVWENEFFTIHASINKEALLMRFLPDFVKPTMVYMTSYLTQGYYALSLALTEPFTPMFGIGNSMFLMDNFKKIFDADFFQYTYQTRLSYLGWDSLANWHSIYVWLANDISFIGILPLLYMLGKYFGNICKDVIINKNPIACVILCLLFIMFFYFPLNNQVLSYPTTFMAFWGLTFYWILQKITSRKRWVKT